jgi:hypothetical protein
MRDFTLKTTPPPSTVNSRVGFRNADDIKTKRQSEEPLSWSNVVIVTVAILNLQSALFDRSRELFLPLLHLIRRRFATVSRLELIAELLQNRINVERRLFVFFLLRRGHRERLSYSASFSNARAVCF